MTDHVQQTEKIATENPVRENQERRTSEKNTATSSSTTTTAATVPGVFQIPKYHLEPYELEEIREAYVNLLGNLNYYKAQIIQYAIENAIDKTAILDAIEQTAYAPRPSHAYFAAILKRYVQQEIRTAKDAEEDRMHRQIRQYIANRDKFSAWYDKPADEDDLPF